MIQVVSASVELMGCLMTPAQKEDPVWLSWLAHVDYFVCLMQTSFTEQQLDELDRKIIHAHTLFLGVTEFQQLWLPKHHFALHFVEDVRRFGPPRSYWCMRFEAKNQEFKKAALMGNFRNVPKTIVSFWAARSGERLRRVSVDNKHSQLATLNRGSATYVVEQLTPNTCFEHQALYTMLGNPDFPVQLTFVSSMRVLGQILRPNSWVSITDSSLQTFLACIKALICVSAPEIADDTLYCISASTYNLMSNPFNSGATSGTCRVDSHTLRERQEMRAFLVGYISLSSLMCFERSGVCTFILAP